MNRAVLITGGAGFLGQAVAGEYSRRGWDVTGIGHAKWTQYEALQAGYGIWHSTSVDYNSLSRLSGSFDVVVHCAGSGSVPFSLKNPFEAFRNIVQTTAEILEYCASLQKPPMFVYPSSAAVYGAAPDYPLSETSLSNPVSPYGYYKRMTEDLLASYTRFSGLRAAVIRFFSIYGPGLSKQLLWDASVKLTAGESSVVFWGTGNETRDWIHVSDAARLILIASEVDQPMTIINGGSGLRFTVHDTLTMLRQELDSSTCIEFNGSVRAGDPQYYLSDTALASKLGWSPQIQFRRGLKEYATWFHTSR
jgi:UDP-glucose 4-epimerase